MTTKAELRRLVLSHLRVIDPTQNVHADQQGLVDLYIDGVRAELLEDGLCWWDEDSIPAAVSIPLSRFVASQACGAFGKAGKGYEDQAISARKRIAKLKSSEERPEVVGQFY
jgi:hypothetical protein